MNEIHTHISKTEFVTSFFDVRCLILIVIFVRNNYSFPCWCYVFRPNPSLQSIQYDITGILKDPRMDFFCSRGQASLVKNPGVRIYTSENKAFDLL